MRKRLSYKEISIFLGILVALTILTITWLYPVSGQSLNNSIGPMPEPIAPVGKILTEKLIHTIHWFR